MFQKLEILPVSKPAWPDQEEIPKELPTPKENTTGKVTDSNTAVCLFSSERQYTVFNSTSKLIELIFLLEILCFTYFYNKLLRLFTIKRLVFVTLLLNLLNPEC